MSTCLRVTQAVPAYGRATSHQHQIRFQHAITLKLRHRALIQYSDFRARRWASKLWNGLWASVHRREGRTKHKSGDDNDEGDARRRVRRGGTQNVHPTTLSVFQTNFASATEYPRVLADTPRSISSMGRTWHLCVAPSCLVCEGQPVDRYKYKPLSGPWSANKP